MTDPRYAEQVIARAVRCGFELEERDRRALEHYLADPEVQDPVSEIVLGQGGLVEQAEDYLMNLEDGRG